MTVQKPQTIAELRRVMEDADLKLPLLVDGAWLKDQRAHIVFCDLVGCRRVTAQARLALIAAAVNAIPTLLDRMREAEVIIEVLGDAMRAYCRPNDATWCDAWLARVAKGVGA